MSSITLIYWFIARTGTRTTTLRAADNIPFVSKVVEERQRSTLPYDNYRRKCDIEKSHLALRHIYISQWYMNRHSET